MSKKERLIMELLYKNRATPMFGSDLIAKSNGELSRGTIYVWLSNLEDAGLVEGVSMEPETPGMLPRRRYHLTTKGMNIMYGTVEDEAERR